ncbi:MULTISPECIES: hemolysin family protein [Sphingobium]|jgi:putative hemolysin|uniref:DNA-binding protein n=1 Tax=Sphingobium fuliginis (strain ATCC 27551) TaxID=336203 RepID=A0A292ZHW1_SPHSA|nr:MULTISPECIES: hemolysin family protein [Sphingobium]AJR22653.1 DNA-binding protein [Sphingobium sp. YBL2]MCB4861384.1 hemolysin family protein [Sphingobium sp. PNB]PNP93765.1 DNA-binding protein [Sphingobium sp. SA916]QOT70594.1 HlyC/CorC family transporter [Sphingobium fuliginis]RYM01025.1 HlyC/CorC family transporter [Sphingobium fuliginis]
MANIPPHAPTPFPWVDLVIILALVALNGLFAMSELAIVSARKPRLQAMEKAGRRGARSALAAASDPGKFLSTVQIGITLIGIVAGAYSGASLGGPTGERLAMLGLSPHAAQNAGFALVIGLTTYASLIVGELVPKQFALRAPEPIAVLVAGPMLWLAKVTAPIVWVLDGSSALIFRLLGLTRESENQVTAEELHLIVAEASRSGVIEESERAIISGVVRLADRPVREVMTQRMDVDWIDIHADEEAIRAKLLDTPHTRLPVGRGTVEDIIGVVQARDIMTALFRGEGLSLERLMRKVEVVPDQVDAMDALEVLRRAEVPMVMVHDEYGHFEGIATPADLLSAIAGHFVSDLDSEDEPDLVEREDGSLLVSGQMPVDLLADRIGIDLPEDRDYATVAGHALWLLKRLPEVGDFIDDQGWRFEIVDMDGRKIDKLLIAER